MKRKRWGRIVSRLPEYIVKSYKEVRSGGHGTSETQEERIATLV